MGGFRVPSFSGAGAGLAAGSSSGGRGVELAYGMAFIFVYGGGGSTCTAPVDRTGNKVDTRTQAGRYTNTQTDRSHSVNQSRQAFMQTRTPGKTRFIIHLTAAGLGVPGVESATASRLQVGLAVPAP